MSKCAATSVAQRGAQITLIGAAWTASRRTETAAPNTSTRATPIDPHGAGQALTWNGHAWTTPATIDPHGGGLTAISCPTSSSCTAVDFAGRIVTLH